MTEPNSSNHWDLLATELGAKVSPRAEEPRRSEPPPAKPIPASKASQRPPARDRTAAASSPASWDEIARELGVPIAPSAAQSPSSSPSPPPPTPPIASRSLQPSATSAPPVERNRNETTVPQAAEPVRRPPALPEAVEDSPNFFDERFDFEEPFDLLESGESPAQTETSQQAAEPSEKRSRKRRRRRPRDRAPESPETEEQRQPTEAEKSIGEREPAGAESEPRRGKRRRPRRGKKHRSSEEITVGAGEPPRDQTDSTHAQPRSRLSPEIRESADAERNMLSDRQSVRDRDKSFSEDDDDETPAKNGFRGIPPGEDAGGRIVDKKLAARAKRPPGAPHSPRGQRGGRDGRTHSGKRRSS